MPPEWARHEATWIAWPHETTDWLEKFAPIDWVYTEIVRALGDSERVEILVHDEKVLRRAEHCLEQTKVNSGQYRLHLVPNNRSWLRDSAPTAVRTSTGELEWVRWKFRAWAKYDNYNFDEVVSKQISHLSNIPFVDAERPDKPGALTLEGGAIDVDGEGTLLTTEECLLSREQERNKELTRSGYEEAFKTYLGIKKVIWLGKGCVGDDTHGHIDDIARFVAPGKVVLAYEANPKDENHASSADNLNRLKATTDAEGRKLQITLLPMPRPIWFGEERLPASYANFYIANTSVLVPTFNDENDRVVLNTLQELFPQKKVVGIHALDLVMGQGTLHCLTQQQPSVRD